MEIKRQEGFGGGLWEGRDALDAMPDGCVQTAYEMFVDPAGVLRSRGHMPQLQGTHWNTDRLTWVWEGQLTPGSRVLFASRSVPGSPGITNASHGMGVLDGSNNGLRLSGGGGYYYMDYPTSYVLLDSMLFIGGVGAALAGGDNTDTTKQGMLYGGSLKTSNYTPGGTHTVTDGSAVVTRAAGGYTANVDAGMLMFSPGGAGGVRRYHVVKTVDSDTQITLVQPYRGTTGTITPDFRPLAYIGAGSSGGGTYRASGLYGSVAGRLLSLEGNKLYVSDGPDPATGASQAQSFPTTNVIEFPLDAQGVAIQTIRNQTFVFTSAGLYRVTGLEYDIVDPDGNPQWTVELLSRELVALSNCSIATWHQALIVPARDGIYVVDGVNPPQSISQGCDWQQVVNAGRNLGQAAIFQGYYLLPVERSAGSLTFDTFVFRLQPVETSRGLVSPFTRWRGDVEAYYSSAATRLLGTATLIWDGGKVFDPTVTLGADGANALGDPQATVTPQVTFKPFRLGGGAVVRRVRFRSSRLAAGQCTGLVGPAAGAGSFQSFSDAAAVAQSGERWIAYELSAPAGGDVMAVSYTLAGRFALLAAEVQYRATGWPAP